MHALRFALVTTFYPPFSFGADAIYVQRLARALVKRGHAVDVIHDTDAFRMMSGLVPQIPFDDDGVRVHRLRSPHKVFSSLTVQQLGRPTTHRERLEELLTGRYDVINYLNTSLIGGPGLWKLGTGIKLHTALDHWLVCPSHTLWRNNRETCDAKRCLRCVLSHRRPPQLWRAGGKLHRDGAGVDAFLMLSRAAIDRHRAFGFRHKMTQINPFLPDEGSGLAPAREPRRNPFVLFVGRLDNRAGLMDVIPQMDEEIGVDLLIAGTGPQEDVLRTQAAGNGRIHFLGRKGAEDLRQLYRDAIAVIAPGQAPEVVSLPVMEAFRAGTPVIARDTALFSEIVTETGGGCLFSDGADMGRILRRLARDRVHATELGRHAFAGFARNWREDVAMAVYFDVIEDAARTRGLADLVEKLASRHVRAKGA